MPSPERERRTVRPVTSTTVDAFAVGGVTVTVDGPCTVIDRGMTSGPVDASRCTSVGKVTVPPVGHASMSACTSERVAAVMALPGT